MSSNMNIPPPPGVPVRQSSSHSELSWKDATKREMLGSMEKELAKLKTTAKENKIEDAGKELNGFRSLFKRFLVQKPTVDWGLIQPLEPDTILGYSSLPQADLAKVRAQLDKLVVVKLNGGLGTSMGCKGPKSLITVRQGLTFLDLNMQQIQHLNNTFEVDVPLVLMNSFNTSEDTEKILQKYRSLNVTVRTFEQSCYPRIDKETLMPIAKSLQQSDKEAFYPPGHGNFYEAFAASGILDEMIKKGKEYCFLSNIDNLGATVDFQILNFLLEPTGHGRSQPPEFLMEVTDKTQADVKGGTLIKYQDKLTLLEIAQVPKDYTDEFKSVNKFRIFNTNNLWANLGSIKNRVESNNMEMEVIVNPKHLGGGVEVIQLETAAGAAIKNFNGACGINVPRSRFLPVKKTQDLLLMMSNLYDMHDGTLVLSKKRMFPTTPLVKLGTSFDKVQEFWKRFPGIPDILELDHLTVSGDVNFGKGVTLKGTVIIIANHGDRIDIPPGALLENKIVSGNLRILDH